MKETKTKRNNNKKKQNKNNNNKQIKSGRGRVWEMTRQEVKRCFVE